MLLLVLLLLLVLHYYWFCRMDWKNVSNFFLVCWEALFLLLPVFCLFTVYLPPYPEKVKPPTTTAPPVVETQSRWLKKPISEYSVEYRTQTAYALLSLCCATPSCNDTRDKWNGICETLILPAESCQPLWEIRCEVILTYDPFFNSKSLFSLFQRK